jgi:threonyl-tRNA synthetase
MTDPSFYVVTSDDVVPIGCYQGADLGAGMECLIEQEILGRRSETVPDRLAELLQDLGFEWEPLSEPGHMRFLGHAAFMLGQAKEHAARVAGSILQAADISAVPLDGVSLVDQSTPVMRRYLEMTSADASLYGDSAYEVTGAGRAYMLRQTGCFQKFAACLDRRLVAGSLPVALFEISDSFRWEPENTLQLSHRLRRFHLPEAHIHTRTVHDAAELSHQLHPRILSTLSELEADLVLLICATHEFASSHPDYLQELASRTNSPALLKVSAPGTMCEDGVEVDVEYKIVDSTGCCRELSTFQIDEQITSTFGVRCDDGTTPATIHSVFSGGVERYLYMALDRIVRSEANGLRRHLPLWISPVVARVVPADAASTQSALSIADRLSGAGIRTELDDRGQGTESAISDADSLLVPYLILANEDSARSNVIRVRDFVSGTFTERDIRNLITETQHAGARRSPDRVNRLSRQPIKAPSTAQGAA